MKIRPRFFTGAGLIILAPWKAYATCCSDLRSHLSLDKHAKVVVPQN
jgi:hypothetical protein